MANLLQAVQHSISPGGIFLYGAGTLDGLPALIIAKLEHEQGVRARQTILPGGETVFDVKLLRDLLFTTGSKVYKVALFSDADVNDANVKGVVVDKQAVGSSVASYYLSQFLGCKLAERPDVLTERFHDAAQSWINDVPEPEKRGRYEVALLSELQSNRSTVSVDRFASNHLDLLDRDDFRNNMHASVPLREFDKDVTLIASKSGASGSRWRRGLW